MKSSKQRGVGPWYLLAALVIAALALAFPGAASADGCGRGECTFWGSGGSKDGHCADPPSGYDDCVCKADDGNGIEVQRACRTALEAE